MLIPPLFYYKLEIIPFLKIKIEEELSPCENALRILSWNLDGLSVEKARNPGVINVISRLLLRYHISVAVIQGVVEPSALQEVLTIIHLYLQI